MPVDTASVGGIHEEGCLCWKYPQSQTCHNSALLEIAHLREFRSKIEAAWKYAADTSKGQNAYIRGNKLRRLVREALNQ